MSVFYFKPPEGWLVLLPPVTGVSKQEKIRLPGSASDEELSLAIRQAERAQGEVRSYFKGLNFGSPSLPIQAQAILTQSPAGTVQEFHGHDGSCLELTCVTQGKLLAVEHPSLSTDELQCMIIRGQYPGDILVPNTMHIADPVARHTIAVLEHSIFWTWQLPVPREGDPAFKTRRIAM